jgi:4-diphosphocytidyl-2-C-methyl-D-erythritol kinase
MSRTRQARVRAYAKINLDLRVLGPRPDGYHELRTIFQTISLADTIQIAFTPSRKTRIELHDILGIPKNLAMLAARLAMDAMRLTGRVEMRLEKRIPMGAGLGGGSSDAAAVLLALPALAGRVLSIPTLCELGQQLGSDVPFFLLGGAAVGIGRGAEVFPLPDLPRRHGLLVAPGIHIDTAEAYRALSPRLTSELQQNKIFSFLSHTWGLSDCDPAVNDFEAVVFEQHRRLAAVKRRLSRAGASVAMMTGSGSAIFGLFPNGAAASGARRILGDEETVPFSLVSRARYRGMWYRALAPHITRNVWPPRSRYQQ